MRDRREYLNPVAYAEMKRRGWSDPRIARVAGVHLTAVETFKRTMGYTFKGKYFFDVENFVKNKSN